jgi:Tol biopolymer transport system component
MPATFIEVHRNKPHPGPSPKILVSVGLSAAVLATALASTARATFPGRDGRIAITAAAKRVGFVDTIRPDGSDRRPVSRSKVARTADGVSWSGSGKEIAFGKRGAIGKMRSNGSHAHILLRGSTSTPNSPGRLNANIEEPAFSPNGKLIVFVASNVRRNDQELMTMRSNGGNVRHLVGTAEGIPLDTHDPRYYKPDWSPSGKRIAFTAPDIDGSGKLAVYTVAPDGSHFQKLRVGDGASYLPSGKRIALYAGAGKHQAIKTMRPNGTDLRPVRALQPFTRAVNPVYSPSGREIVFDGLRSGKRGWVLATLRTDGTHLRVLKSAENPPAPLNWQPR